MQATIRFLLTGMLVSCCVVSSARTDEKPTRPIEELRGLVGSWKCQTKLATFRSEFRWVLDKTYLEHEQTLTFFGSTHRVRETLGYDPQTKTLRGWIFSKEWVATATYTKDADKPNTWNVDVVLTRTNGKKSRKRKIIEIRDGKMLVTVVEGQAPLKEFNELEFVRNPK